MSAATTGGYRLGVLRRRALVPAVVAVLAVVSMHAFHAHPGVALHLHAGPAAVPATSSAATVHHAPAGQASHQGPGAHAVAAVEHTAAAGPAPVGAGQQGNGELGALAHHIAMCAVVVLAGLAAAERLAGRGRISPAAGQRLTGTFSRVEPPVPRPVLVRT